MRLGAFSFGFLIVVSFVAGAMLSDQVPIGAWAERLVGTWSSAAPPSGAKKSTPIAIKSAAVEIGPVTQRVISVGSLAAEQSVVIQPEIAGKVIKMGFAEGETVAEGQVLVELDAAISVAESARAEAQLALAVAEFKRADQLAEQGIGTARARDEAAALLAVARAEVGLASARLAKSTIVAPFPGIVGLSDVTVGKFLAAGEAIVNLERIDPLKVDFRVPENYVQSLAKGQTIEVGVDAFPGRLFAGEVFAIDPLVDVNGRAVRIRARIPNRDGTLKPGLFARVTLVLNFRAEAMLVPEGALAPDGGALVVYRIEEETARRVVVETGQRREGKVEILGGLAPGDRVVVEGQLNLFDGAQVVEAP